MNQRYTRLNQQRILTLHPFIRDKVRQFLSLAKESGIDLLITSGMRTFQEQEKIYQQGRTLPGPIVSWAKPGTSYHNYGLAIDVVPIVNGQAIWGSTNTWNRLGALGKSLGFTWGGDWKRKPDRPHFQLELGYKIADLLALHQAKKYQNGFLILSPKGV
jgi:peptidoglycan L-alanyl-D-glutamate endopeptidase CwlK